MAQPGTCRAVPAENPRQILHNPVYVTFIGIDRLDIDNHALMGKMTVDALKGWVLPDDGKRHFRAVTRILGRRGASA